MSIVSIEEITKEINGRIASIEIPKQPQELYHPIKYTLENGGKRMRPLLTVLSYSLFKDDPGPAIQPAIAIELFHNFTLIHDDIIDQAPLRRGKPSVHERWNENIAILSGDAMLLKAYQFINTMPNGQLETALLYFNRTALEVMEGQQWDINYENESEVSEEQYLEMIGKKTASLISFSVRLGAILAGASETDQGKLAEFGLNLGMAFQLKDDLLDVYADEKKFGKQIGGDIISNKKTYLLIKALEKAKGTIKNELVSWINKKDFDPDEKVNAVKSIYNELDIAKLTQRKMDEYYSSGSRALDALSMVDDKMTFLKKFAGQIINRDK